MNRVENSENWWLKFSSLLNVHLKCCIFTVCVLAAQEVKPLIAWCRQRRPSPCALSLPGCSPWYVAEVQDSLCSLRVAQGGRPQGSERIPVQRRGGRGARGAWRFGPDAAGCSFAPCSAAGLQAARRAADLQARWAICSNPTLTEARMAKYNRKPTHFGNYPSQTRRLPWSHGVLWVPASVRRAGAAPHQEARQELHCEGREASKSITQRGVDLPSRDGCGGEEEATSLRLPLICQQPNWLRNKASFIRAVAMISSTQTDQHRAWWWSNAALWLWNFPLPEHEQVYFWMPGLFSVSFIVKVFFVYI